jgi:hypothetical protein
MYACGSFEKIQARLHFHMVAFRTNLFIVLKLLCACYIELFSHTTIVLHLMEALNIFRSLRFYTAMCFPLPQPREPWGSATLTLNDLAIT